jgi:hypothetical protein
LTLRLELICFEPVSEQLPHAEDVIDLLLSRVQAIEGLVVSAAGDIRHWDRLVGQVSRAEQRLTVPLRPDISIARGIGDELVAEYPRLRREGDNLVLDLDGPAAVDAAEKLLQRRLMTDRYASQYLESSP